MKSGKWTAAQNKAEESDGIDSIGELVLMCEKEGFIPKYYTPSPQDKVDRLIQDLQKFTTELVNNEAGLSTLVERAVVQMNEEEQRINKARIEGEANTEDEMFNYDKPVFKDEDYSEFKDFQEEQLKENDE